MLQTTYFDARRGAITELVERLDRSHELAPTWLPERAVDALMIITSLKAFETSPTTAVFRSKTRPQYSGAWPGPSYATNDADEVGLATSPQRHLAR